MCIKFCGEKKTNNQDQEGKWCVVERERENQLDLVFFLGKLNFSKRMYEYVVLH